MIWNLILGVFRAVANAVLDLLPVVDPTPLDLGSWTVAGSVVDAVMPWSHALAAAAVMLGWMVVCHGYRIVLWILGVLHISGSDT